VNDREPIDFNELINWLETLEGFTLNACVDETGVWRVNIATELYNGLRNACGKGKTITSASLNARQDALEWGIAAGSDPEGVLSFEERMKIKRAGR